MSWFRFAGPAWGGNNHQGLWDRIFSRVPTRSRKRARSRKRGFDQGYSRSLRIDPLEAHCLLSVTPATLSAIIVNQTFGSAQDTNTAHSVASDNSGDFVVTWTRSDPVLNAEGQPLINPITGEPYQVENVYARYYTPTEEQITLPTGTTRFSLTDNDQTIDQISITAGTAPSGDPTAPAPNMVGTFTLWFDANGDGIATANELQNFNYNEIDPSATAAAIQTWLNGFTPVAGVSDGTQATVNAIDADDFVVDFGTATQGLNQSALLQYVSPSNDSMLAAGAPATVFAFPGGYLPTVAVTTLDRPFTINNIPASPTNPSLTALAISSYFQPPAAAGAEAVAPVDFPTPEEIKTPPGQTLAPYTDPVATNSPINTTPTTFVTAEPVTGADGTLSLTEFDITFTGYVNGGGGSSGESAATVDAAMVVNNCVNANGAALASTSLSSEGVPYDPSLPAMFSNSVSTGNNVQQLTFAAANGNAINSTFELQVGPTGTPDEPDHIQQRQSGSHGNQHSKRAHGRRSARCHRGDRYAGLLVRGQ